MFVHISTHQNICPCVCIHTCVYLFLKDMDLGSWLSADGFIQVEYKHWTLLKSNLCPCLDYAALSLRWVTRNYYSNALARILLSCKQSYLLPLLISLYNGVLAKMQADFSAQKFWLHVARRESWSRKWEGINMLSNICLPLLLLSLYFPWFSLTLLQTWYWLPDSGEGLGSHVGGFRFFTCDNF